MNRVQTAAKDQEKLLQGEAPSGLAKSDPKLAAIKDRLIFGEITGKGSLSASQQELVTLAGLAAIWAEAPLQAHVNAALNGLAAVNAAAPE